MTLFAQAGPVTLHHGDVLDVLADLPDGCVDAVVTSPPYLGLRDYGVPPTDWPQVEYVPMTGLPAVTVPAMTCVLGLESEPLAYVAHLVVIFREIRRVLALDGVCWLNLGDSYSMDSKWGGATGGRHAKALHGSPGGTRDRRPWPASPDKNLIGVPWRTAMALQGDGWVLRNDLIWDKPNAMPSPVRDRLTSTHEHVFLLARGPRYFFDLDAIREPLAHPDAADGSRVFGGRHKAVSNAFLNASERTRGRAYVRSHPGGKNPGDVWSISTSAFPQAHHATMSPRLAERLVLSSAPLRRCPECGPISVDCGHDGTRPGLVFDPFSGAGTTGMAAIVTGREYVGIDASAANLDLSLKTRLSGAVDGGQSA